MFLIPLLGANRVAGLRVKGFGIWVSGIKVTYG